MKSDSATSQFHCLSEELSLKIYHDQHSDHLLRLRIIKDLDESH